MKKIKYILLFLFIMCHISMISASTIIENDSLKIDSTQVKYFYKNFNNLTLGDFSTYDTTTLLSSFYEPLEKPYSIYQTLSNSGLAHKNIRDRILYYLDYHKNKYNQ